MADFGGHIRFLFGDVNLVIRGKFDIEPVDEDFEGLTNQDGSVSRTRKPNGYRWSATFEDTDDPTVNSATGLDWSKIMKGGPYNITIPEDDTGVLHAYTKCNLIGRVRIDRMNGEVTGIEGLAPIYKRTTTA